MNIKEILGYILMVLPMIESHYKKKSPLAAKLFNYFRIAMVAIINEEPIPPAPKEFVDAKRSAVTPKNAEEAEARAFEKLLEA
jgi:hypothetical protein